MSTTTPTDEATEFTLRAVCINITAHPHSDPLTYSNLFKKALKREIKFWGEKFGKLTTFESIGDGVYKGTLATFHRVDRGSNWGNTLTGESLEEDAVDQLPMPPPHLGHDFDRHHFVLHEREHKLIAECSTFEPRRWRSLLGHLLRKAGSPDGIQVNVTVVPKNDTIEWLLNMDRVTKLVLRLSRPNPDDLEPYQAEILDRLDRQNSKSLELSLSAAPQESVDPDDETRKLARVAQTNGWVKTEGRSNGELQVRSTKSHPRIESIKSRGSIIDALIELSTRFLG